MLVDTPGVDLAGRCCVACGGTLHVDGESAEHVTCDRCSARFLRSGAILAPSVPAGNGSHRKRATARPVAYMRGRPPIPAELARQLEGDRLLTPAEAAAALGIPVYTFNEWGRRGVLPSLVLGRHRFVRASTLHQWLEEHETGGNGEVAPGRAHKKPTT